MRTQCDVVSCSALKPHLVPHGFAAELSRTSTCMPMELVVKNVERLSADLFSPVEASNTPLPRVAIFGK